MNVHPPKMAKTPLLGFGRLWVSHMEHPITWPILVNTRVLDDASFMSSIFDKGILPKDYDHVGNLIEGEIRPRKHQAEYQL